LETIIVDVTSPVKEKGWFWTLESSILAPTCLLSHPKILSESAAPRVCPLSLM